MFWRMVKLQSFVKISLKISQFMKHGPRKGPERWKNEERNGSYDDWGDCKVQSMVD